MLCDSKRTEVVSLKLTEREFVALCRLAGHADRKPGEMARYIVRAFMFGNVDLGRSDDQQNGSDHE